MSKSIIYEDDYRVLMAFVAAAKYLSGSSLDSILGEAVYSVLNGLEDFIEGKLSYNPEVIKNDQQT